MYSFLYKLILYGFLILLEHSTSVSYFMTGLIFVFHIPVSYKKSAL